MALQIGELARRTGKSIHTLRYYESEGLIPNVRRNSAGRRVYSERHVLWIELLGRLRQTGMTMQSIREYAALIAEGDVTLSRRKNLLGAHRKKIEAQIDDMKACIRLIDLKLELYESWIEVGRSPIDVPGQFNGSSAGISRLRHD